MDSECGYGVCFQRSHKNENAGPGIISPSESPSNPAARGVAAAPDDPHTPPAASPEAGAAAAPAGAIGAVFPARAEFRLSDRLPRSDAGGCGEMERRDARVWRGAGMESRMIPLSMDTARRTARLRARGPQ